MFLSGFFVSATLSQDAQTIAINEAYTAGIKNADWKVALKSDQKVASKACTIWWFDMTAKERKIEVPHRKATYGNL